MAPFRKTLEQTCLAAFTPPITIERPTQLLSPVIFCSPHSGRLYPPAFLSQSQQSLIELRQNEDSYIDKLYAPAVKLGAPLLSARFPRCFLDVNRAIDELPPAWLPPEQTATPHAQAGFGLIPLNLSATRPIYKQLPEPEIAQARIEYLYKPYHEALRSLIHDAKAAFGKALIIDCHSMPGFSTSGIQRPDIVLGDRYGTSCQPNTLNYIENLFKSRQYFVRRNHPYAGGYVTSHYGQPHDNVEAIQIEISRDLYVNPITLKPKRNYERLESNLYEIIQRLITDTQMPSLIAAE